MRIILFVILTLVFLGCRHEIENPKWDVDIIFPILNSQIDLNNISIDSNLLIDNNDDGYLSLIYSESILDINLDSMIKIDAIADEKTHTLDSTTFKDVIITDTATIGETINDIPFGTVLFPNGTTNSIPSLTGVVNEDTINIDASEYFQTMTLFKGNLIIEFINNYPTDISNVQLSLINSVNQNLIANFTFPLVPTGSTVSDSVSVAGKTLDENLLAIIHNMDIDASNGPVFINYDDAIITKVVLSDIGITQATAIFPEQQLTETLKEHTFDFNRVEIKEIGIKNGKVTIYVLSTLPNGKMIYNIPSLKKDGVSFTSGEMFIPEATSNNLTAFEFDFEGYTLDLTGQEERLGGDTINTIYTEAYTFIDSTGLLETINYQDSFYSYVDFNITPEYAIGYLGQDTISFGPEIKKFNFFNNISSNFLSLEKANLEIEFNNYIGADLAIQIKDFEISNSNSNVNYSNLIDNNGNNVVNNLYNLERATLTTNSLPINSKKTSIFIDANEIIEILPNNLIASGSLYLNPNGNLGQIDFLYPDYPPETNIKFDVPLNINTKELTLIDTSEINFPSNNNFDISSLYLNINNGFPFSANIKLISLDSENNVLDTIKYENTILPGLLSNQNNNINPQQTIIEIDASKIQQASKLITVFTLSTIPANQHIKIYDFYSIKFLISAIINQKLND